MSEQTTGAEEFRRTCTLKWRRRRELFLKKVKEMREGGDGEGGGGGGDYNCGKEKKKDTTLL